MSSSSKRRRLALTEADLQNFIDNIDEEDDALGDIDFVAEFEASDDEHVETPVEDPPDIADNLENEEEEPREECRKQYFLDLDSRLAGDNYESLPEQKHAKYKSMSSDKKIIVEWETHKDRVGRTAKRNICNGVPGPSRLARSGKDPLAAWKRFIPDDYIVIIVEYTNRKIVHIREAFEGTAENDKYTHCHETDPDEIRALFGLLYLRASLKLNLRRTADLFYHRSAHDIFSSNMNQKRFVFLLSLIEFDNFTTRPERWQSDKFAAIRDFFEYVNERCAIMRVPSEYLSLDETLYPYRGRVKMRQYNPNKPAKYGLLYRSISDARVPYTYFSLPYAGKPEGEPNHYYVTGTDEYTKYLVENLAKFADVSGRNVSMDRHFTSIPIARWLMTKNLSVVGTLKANRAGLPKELTSMHGQENLSVRYAYADSGNILLVSYITVKKSGMRNVLVLSTMHDWVGVTRDTRRKPNVIVMYDCTKGGVDVMDMIAGSLSTRILTRRWPMNDLAYILDTVRTNSQTIVQENLGKDLNSFQYTWELGEALVRPHMLTRYQLGRGLQSELSRRMRSILNIPEVVRQVPPADPNDRKRCYLCLEAIAGQPNYKKNKDRLAKVKWVCSTCNLTACLDHLVVKTCSKCAHN